MARRRYRRRKVTKKDLNALGSLFVFGVLFLIVSAAYSGAVAVWNSAIGQAAIRIVVGAVALAVLLKLISTIVSSARASNERQRIEGQIREVAVSGLRHDYLIEGDDYKGGNPKENLYRKSFQLTLFQVYGNRCAKCGSNDNGVEIDHFFLSTGGAAKKL